MGQQWFYTKDRKTRVGPVSSAELKALARSGQLLPTDMVLMQGIKQWTAASEIKELFADPESSPNASPPPKKEQEDGQRAVPAPRYYFMHDGQRFGAVSLDQLVEAIACRQLVADDLVWMEGTPQWVPARALFANPVKTPTAPAEEIPTVLPVEPSAPVGRDITVAWNNLPWGASQADFKRRFPRGSQTGNQGQWWITGEEEPPFAGIRGDARYAFNKKGQFIFVLLISDRPDDVYDALLKSLGMPDDGRTAGWTRGPVKIEGKGGAERVAITITNTAFQDEPKSRPVLSTCLACGRQVSNQAEACPGCGQPMFEYCTVKVTECWNEGRNDHGQEKYKNLRREGWEVVESQDMPEETWVNREGNDCWFTGTIYKLRRSLLKPG